MIGPRCCATVFSGTIRGHGCRVAPKVERDGKHYCTTHDPIRRAEKEAAKWAAHEAERVAANKRREDAARATAEIKRRAGCYDDLLAALQWMVENDDTYEGNEPLPDHYGLTWNEINAHFIAGLNNAKAAIAKATGEQQ